MESSNLRQQHFRSILIGAALVVATLFAIITCPFGRPWAAESLVLSREALKNILIVDPDPEAQLKTLATIARQPMSDNDIIVPWLKQNADKLHPLLLAELARRLFEQSHPDGLEWFAIVDARTVYDAKRCEDRTAGSGLAFVLARVAGQPLISYLLSHPDEYGTAQQRALARTDLFSDAVSPAWICVHGISAYSKAISGQPAEIRIKPREQWPAVQRAVRAEIEAAVHQSLAHRAARKALPAGTVELRAPHNGVPFSLAWSPDSKLLAMTFNGDEHVAIWNIELHSLVQEIDRGTALIDNIEFLSGGEIITSSFLQSGSSQGTVLTVLSADGAAIRHFGQVRPNARFAVDTAHNAIAYLTQGFPTPAVMVGDLDNPSNSAPVTLDLKGVPSSLAFGPDGVLAIGTLSGQIFLLDKSSYRLLRTIDAFDDAWIESVAFSPDGHYLASGSVGGRSGFRGKDGVWHQVNHIDTLKIWTVANGRLVTSCSELVTKDEGATVRSVAWSPDSRYLAYTGYNNVHLLDIESPQHMKTLMQFSPGSSQYSNQALAFSPDGKRLAMTGDDIALVVPFLDAAAASDVHSDASCK
jgi:hypothetical protein